MRYGIAHLGGARYKKTIREEHPRSWGMSIFSKVDGFGDGTAVAAEMAPQGLPFMVLQLMWKDGHNFKDSDIPFVKSEARRLKPVILANPNVDWFVSPVCEHELKEAGWTKFAAVVIEELRGCKYEIVNTPNGSKGFVSKNYLNEFHGGFTKVPSGVRIAFNFDGQNCVDLDVELYKKLYANAEYFLFWNSQCNGNRVVSNNPKDKVPRAKRTFWPTPKQIDSWVWLGTHSKGETKKPKGVQTLKSHSDQHSVPPAGKDQKPVIITDANYKPSRLVCKARNGQVVAQSAPPMPFNDDKGRLIGWRYYFAEWGFEISQKGIRIQGDALLDVFVDGKKVGVTNLAFRDYAYR